MNKISLSGVYGVGKTSLLLEVKKILSLKYKISSVNDINLKNPFDEEIKSSFISQFFTMTTQINEENVEMQKSFNLLFSDRSILDHWVLWKSSLRNMEMNEKLEEKNILMRNIYKYWIKSYDLIFLVRVDEKEFKKREQSTEFKVRNFDYIKQTEELFFETIKEDNLKVIEIWNNLSIDESAHKVIQSISAHDLI